MNKYYVMALSILSFNVMAGMTVSEYQSTKLSDKEEMEWYVAGLGNGFAFSNTKLESIHQKRMYCPPSTLKIGIPDLEGFIQKGIDEIGAKESKDIQIEPLLLRQLIQAYPCKR